MNENCAICGQEIVIQSATDWDTYQSNPSSFTSQYAGLRCSNCNAVYCSKLHQKELNFKIFKGGYRSGTCPRCGASLQDSIVLLGEVQKSTFGMTTPAKSTGYLFGEKAQADFDKHSKRLKTTLIISGVGTAWLFVAGLLIALIEVLFPNNAEAILNVFMVIMIIPGLGIYVWPFVIFHAIRKGKAKKELAGMPAPVQERLRGVFIGARASADDGNGSADLIHHVGDAFRKARLLMSHDNEIEIIGESSDAVDIAFAFQCGGYSGVSDSGITHTQVLTRSDKGKVGSCGRLGKVEHGGFMAQKRAHEIQSFPRGCNPSKRSCQSAKPIEDFPIELLSKYDMKDFFVFYEMV